MTFDDEGGTEPCLMGDDSISPTISPTMDHDSISPTMQEPKTTSSTTDFFRTKVSFVEEMKAKRRAAQEKKQRKERRRSSQTHSVERTDPSIHDNKRRRVSHEKDDDSDGGPSER